MRWLHLIPTRPSTTGAEVVNVLAGLSSGIFILLPQQTITPTSPMIGLLQAVGGNENWVAAMFLALAILTLVTWWLDRWRSGAMFVAIAFWTMLLYQAVYVAKMTSLLGAWSLALAGVSVFGFWRIRTWAHG